MNIIIGIVGVVIAYVAVTSIKLADKLTERAQVKADHLIKENHQKAAAIKEQRTARAKEDKVRIKKDNEELEDSLNKQEEIIGEKEELAKKRESRLTQLNGTIKNLGKDIKKIHGEVENRKNELTMAAAERAETTKETVLQDIFQKFEHDFVEWKDVRLRNMDENYKDEITQEAKSILKGALQRYTERSSVDTKEFSFTLKRDSMKGPLVGQGGKNINYFEEKAECAVIFNYEPNLVIVSCLNMYKRAIAKEALIKLSAKKKIDHKTIDHALAEAKKAIDENCLKLGKKAARMLGYDKLNKELLYLVGRFEYRTSYGQNIWWHSMEVSFFARMLAESIGANVKRSLDAAFYHDLGKAIDHDLDTAVGHDYITKDLMEKFKMDPLTIHAAFAHHDAVPCERPEDFLIKAADAMSAARPGARQQTMERYLKLVKELQERAQSCEGVKKAFSVNAGREIRVVVDETSVDDTKTEEIASTIAQDIEANMGYPGTIKVNVIRITEARDTAKEKVKARY